MHELVNGYYKGREALKKPLQNEYYDNYDKPKAACYLGAVYYGLHGTSTTTDIVSTLVEEGYDVLHRWAEPPCDCDPDNAGTVAGIIIHLNDSHSRKQFSEQKITDWLNLALSKNYESYEAMVKANT